MNRQNKIILNIRQQIPSWSISVLLQLSPKIWNQINGAENRVARAEVDAAQLFPSSSGQAAHGARRPGRRTGQHTEHAAPVGVHHHPGQPWPPGGRARDGELDQGDTDGERALRKPWISAAHTGFKIHRKHNWHLNIDTWTK